MPIKSVNEVFTSNHNKAKFCMPLGMASARKLEDQVQKEREQQQQQKMSKKLQKP